MQDLGVCFSFLSCPMLLGRLFGCEGGLMNQGIDSKFFLRVLGRSGGRESPPRSGCAIFLARDRGWRWRCGCAVFTILKKDYESGYV